MTILELAERRAAASQRLRMLSMQNTALTIEGQVRADAQYQLALDLYVKCDVDYRAAMDGLSAEELQTLSGEPVAFEHADKKDK